MTKAGARVHRTLAAVWVALALGSCLSQGSQDDGASATSRLNLAFPAAAAWFISPVDPTTLGPNQPAAGMHVAVAADPTNGRAYVSYHDGPRGDLKLAKFVGMGGNCGRDSDWTCGMLDGPVNEVGQYTSIDILGGAGAPWKLGIAYLGYYGSDHALRYAEYACADVDTGCQWIISTVDMGGGHFGDSTSLQFDRTGTPHIAFHRVDPESAIDELSFARFVGHGGNCGLHAAEGQWQCDSIDGMLEAGIRAYASLALDAADVPRIAYQKDGGLWHAEFVAAGGNCGPEDTWQCDVVDSEAGQYPSLVVDREGAAYIGYRDSANGTLKVARFVGSGGSCTDDRWHCTVVDAMGTSNQPMGLSLALDLAGYPVVAYQDASGDPGPRVLKVARPVAALGRREGNCGPPVGDLPTWQCDTIDAGGKQLDEAGYASVSVGPRGLATIAYYESRREAPLTVGRLKVARQGFWVYLPLAGR